MKKLLLSTVFIAMCFVTSAQVGIGTASPKVTLDIVGEAGDIPEALRPKDGLGVPIVTDNMTTTTTKGVRTGQLVYSNNTTDPGFYSWSFDTADPAAGAARTTDADLAGRWSKPQAAAIEIGIVTPVNTYLKVKDQSDVVKTVQVIRLVGTTDGETAYMTLTDTSDFTTASVAEFRRAIIYKISTNSGTDTSRVVMEVTGGFDTSTNKFITGNGFMNKVLAQNAVEVTTPAEDAAAGVSYVVELYYISN